MDDTLKRRLVGAAVLVLAALAFTTLLPDPDRRPGESSPPVVAYDLRTGAPLHPQPASPPAVKLKPAEIGAAELPRPQVKTEDASPDTVAAPPAKTEPPKPEAAKPAPVTAKPATPATPAAKPAHPSLRVDESFGLSGTSAWYVQIGSFASKENARAEQLKLAKLGLPAILQGITVERKLWYRVRVGPYQAEGAAQQALSTVRAHGYSAAKVARPDAGAN